MKLDKGYGRFVAAVNLLLAVLFFLVPAQAQTSQVKLAVLGDSLAAGFGLKPTQAFPALVEVALKARGRNVTVLNDGVSGDTSAGGLDRVEWILGDKPDIVLVELGANDALRGVDPATTERNLAGIIEKLREAGVTVWLAGMMAPRNLGSDYVQSFDRIYSRLAAKYEVPLYPFVLDGVAQNPALNQPDGLHPNPKGAEVIAERMLPFVIRNLDRYAASVHRPARP
jgi:acyl-CoA thioesterase-1